MTDNYSFIKVIRLPNFVTHVQLDRPNKLNALSISLWREIGKVFEYLADDEDTRVIVLSGNGKHFCVGIDLNDIQNGIGGDESTDMARKGRNIRKQILEYQALFNQIENCLKPVVVLVHGYCLGAGIDLITACDIRIATAETVFSVKEVDIGMAADVGTLNRLPKVVGNDSWIKDICYSARHFKADEALKFGLISQVYSNKEEAFKMVFEMANNMGLKSPVAVQGTKAVLNYARDHTIRESLEFVANWNASQLMTDDLVQSVVAAMAKGAKPTFSKL
uniref:Delta(3,5)-Delta(2,4)-dienoyl-CoA isomerase, mitochondrial n=1 Tax=Rhabditophanes sp. KR3021 TaxID=114890 RepID=A0AC35U7D8_9BILA